MAFHTVHAFFTEVHIARKTFILAEEFITPLFVIRAEKMSGDDDKDIKSIYEYSTKHVDFFWKAVSNS